MLEKIKAMSILYLSAVDRWLSGIAAVALPMALTGIFI
jgi:hypothetical protein